MAGNDRRKQMANQEHLGVLMQGTATWNWWRKQHPKVQPDLSGAELSNAKLRLADLSGATLSNANLSGANLSRVYFREATLRNADLSRADLRNAILIEANLSEANLSRANLSRATLRNADLRNAILIEANLSEADLRNATLIEANLSRATLRNADLTEANLRLANLSEADLSRADLSFATFVGTKLKGATLTECRIYGISAWDIELTGATQDSLVITPEDEPQITVDNLKIAQFIYLLLNNEEIRDVIDTIAKKAVLILGRFTPERKVVLDALREALRRHEYLPILFDFEKPSSRNFTETVRTLAHLSRFIIADLTDPSSIPQELYAIVPTLAVPVQPLLEAPKREYSMFADFKRYHWVLPVHHYTDLADLLATLKERVIDPAEHKAQELTKP